jgi:hypothetical protein
MIVQEKRDFLSIVAYGIHSKYQKDLRRAIEKEFNCRSVFVYEYFFDTPYVRGQKVNTRSGYLAFLLRILNEQRFVPKVPDRFPKRWNEIEFLPLNSKNLWSFWTFDYKGARAEDISDTDVGKEVFTLWENRETGKRGGNSWVEYDPNTGLVEGVFRFKIDYLKEDYLSYISKKRAISRTGALKEYMVSIYPWLLCPEIEELDIAALSLSTNNIFYGYILIFYPAFSEEMDILKKKDKGETLVAEQLKKVISKYVPTLLLFENCWEEIELSRELAAPQWEKYAFLQGTLNESDNRMEKALYLLWQGRKEFYESFSPRDEAMNRVEESLLFPKYLIAAPSMIDEMKGMFLPRQEAKGRRKKDYLPCFLVIGAPGAGKDTLAQIIQLFFPEYRFGKRYVINMAALKPSFLSVPLMSGFELDEVISHKLRHGKEGRIDVNSEIKGIFLKIWEEHKKHDDLEKCRQIGIMPVVVLDELNSLDVDAQGSLLRILQNARLQPLGRAGEGEEKIDFLVIGTVNEPEEMLTLEEPLRKFITDESVFGGILGKALYEYARNMRRLRDDLYYRLIRDGKIAIPPLNKRREDIPILFSFFIKKEICKEIGLEVAWDQMWFDFDVFEELMDKVYSWSGNFRELETAAKKTAYEVLLDPHNKTTIENLRREEKAVDPILICYRHIEEVTKTLSRAQ